VRHVVSLILESMDAGMDEEAHLFLLFKAEALLGTEHAVSHYCRLETLE
jgi:hypothetical protein